MTDTQRPLDESTLREETLRQSAIDHIEKHTDNDQLSDSNQIRDPEHFLQCFLNLPRELRDNIYEAKFVNLPPSLTLKSKVRTTTKPQKPPPRIFRFVPPLYLINRQVFQESALVLLKNRKIVLGGFLDIDSFFRFLSMVDEDAACRAITMLVLCSRVPRNPLSSGFGLNFQYGQALVHRCTALKHLTLGYDIFNIAVSGLRFDFRLGGSGHTSCYLRLLDDVIEDFGTAVVESQNLQAFTFRDEKVPGSVVREVQRASTEAFYAPFVSWLHKEMKERRPRVEFRAEGMEYGHHITIHYPCAPTGCVVVLACSEELSIDVLTGPRSMVKEESPDILNLPRSVSDSGEMSSPDPEEHPYKGDDSDSEASIEATIAALRNKLEQKRKLRRKRNDIMDDHATSVSQQVLKMRSIVLGSSFSSRHVSSARRASKRQKIEEKVLTIPDPNTFLGLPRELCDKVYVAHFEALPDSTILYSDDLEEGNPDCSQFIPALCYVNHQIFEESVPALLKNRKIKIGRWRNVAILVSFLDRVSGKKAYEAITSLSFEEGFGFMSSATLRLLQQCTRLKVLVVQVDPDTCFKYVTYLKDGKRVTDKKRSSRSEVIEEFGPVIFKLPLLKSLTLLCHTSLLHFPNFDDSSEPLESPLEYFLDCSCAETQMVIRFGHCAPMPLN
ncbi:hypothetical protein P154DRAFT_564362 [Amniculicola lignicola CBS 123094]|uniref:F-box domain-containing protein n=1 Tax=Amniculicola lignicola CBS 123094 TaxID=1392246 RepID=A0A6A5WBI4_9PLEO|nr:hypothetical protein P154DRAFT_564362 [Amniculicola lignicola CBS 123094]